MNEPPSATRPVENNKLTSKRIWLQTMTVTLLVLGLGVWQAHDLGLTTDEATYIEGIDRIEKWVDGFRTNGLFGNLTREKLEAGFSSGEFYNKNPPLISLLGYFSKLAVGRLDSPPASHRWLHVLFFATTCGLIYRWRARDRSPTAGLIAVGTLIGSPRVLSNAGLMALDPLVGGLWVWGTWAVLQRGKSWLDPVVFAIVVGVGFASKPTFWFMIPIWCLWGLVFRWKDAWRYAAMTATVGLLTALVCLPAWWDNPLAGFLRYLKVISSDSGWSGIDAYYWGGIYQLSKARELPWTAVPVLMLVTTPVWILLLWGGALYRWLRFELRSPETWLLVAGFFLLPMIVMLPGTPGHDGVRMFLPSYFFGALLAGNVGADVLGWVSAQATSAQAKRLLQPVWLALIVVAVALVPVCRIHPAGLSYYNLLVGGFPGATAAGRVRADGTLSEYPLFERTYWWEVMNARAWHELQTHLPPGARVWIFPDYVGKDLLKRWGIIRPDIQFAPTMQQADFILLYGRMGQLCRPEVHPLEGYFFTPHAEWEWTVQNVRLAVLIRRK